ncbi:MAG TPA: alpha-L-fucosidase [Phycisphaerae bacterium]|nr:alpha-L-fucosidase [Phycisphaerae bacterium]
MTRHALSLIASLAVLAAGAPAAGPDKPFTADWESLSRHEAAPKWFRDAKFGLYFHWGVYSVPAFGSEWYPRNMHRKAGREYKHHVETYGDPTKFGYADFVPMFQAEKFDPDRWAALFEQAGARFAGPVAEHHDGFAMWASKLTPWNARDAGPKRDIAGELAEAVRKRGMKFVATFHHARNNLWQPKPDQWTGHYQFVKTDFPSLLDDPQRAILYGYLPREQFLKLWLGKLQEVIDNYQPDLIWFDSWLDEIPEKQQMEFLAHYFNQARKWGKDVVVTRKQNDLPLELSVEDFEKGRLDRLTERAWLTDDTISRGSWCYTEDLKIKPLPEVLHVLIDIVSKNGCLLLNISPKADGTIPQVQKDVLLGIGSWLKRFGEAIYDTRPWVVYGEGPTRMGKSGHFVGSVSYTSKDVRFTAKGDVLYAIFLGRPEGKATVASLATGSGLFGGAVKRVSLVGQDAALAHTQDAEGLHVTFAGKLPDENAVAVKIEGLKIAGFQPDLSVRFADGKALLDADAATLHGPKIAKESKDSGRASIGFWDEPTAWVSWDVRFPAAGTYEVRGRFAAMKQGGFKLQVGKSELAGKPPVTGAWDKFQDAPLGTIEVKEAGTQQVKLVPVAAEWAAMNLAWIELKQIK